MSVWIKSQFLNTTGVHEPPNVGFWLGCEELLLADTQCTAMRNLAERNADKDERA